MCDTFNDNNNNCGWNNSRLVRKNEPKFEYLKGIAMEMGIKFDELILEKFYLQSQKHLHLMNLLKILIVYYNKMKQNSWTSCMSMGNHFIVNVN